MLSLSRGLVLRRGDRQLEFERDLGDGRVQLKYMDNFEVCTMKVTDLLKQVYEGKLIPTTIPTRTNQLARIFHRSRATNEYGIALVCPKIQVSNLDQRAGNAEAKLYRRN